MTNRIARDEGSPAFLFRSAPTDLACKAERRGRTPETAEPAAVRGLDTRDEEMLVVKMELSETPPMRLPARFAEPSASLMRRRCLDE